MVTRALSFFIYLYDTQRGHLSLACKRCAPTYALRVNGSITKLNVRYNQLDDEAKTLLRDAAKDKSGFELQL